MRPHFAGLIVRQPHSRKRGNVRINVNIQGGSRKGFAVEKQ